MNDKEIKNTNKEKDSLVKNVEIKDALVKDTLVKESDFEIKKNNIIKLLQNNIDTDTETDTDTDSYISTCSTCRTNSTFNHLL